MHRFLLLLLFCVSGMTASAQTGISKKTRELFAWYDSLGFEDTSKAKFVQIRTGLCDVGHSERIVDAPAGFVIEDHGPTFRAVLADLTVHVFKKQGTSERDGDYCGYRELTLELGWMIQRRWLWR